MDSNLIPYQPVISDIKNLIAAGQNVAYNAANRAMIMTYWNIGKRIVEEEQSGAERAEYGKRLISILSDELTKEFGSNYSGRSLRYYRKFYLCFPDFEIWNTRVPNLNWSHFRALLRVPDEDARVWYMNEASVLANTEFLLGTPRHRLRFLQSLCKNECRVLWHFREKVRHGKTQFFQCGYHL